MPLELFELIDAVSGHRGTVSSFGQERNAVSNIDYNAKNMAVHREIQKQAAEAADEAEKKQIMMELRVFVHNQKNMAEHHEIQKWAAEAADEAEKKRIMMESRVFVHKQKMQKFAEDIAAGESVSQFSTIMPHCTTSQWCMYLLPSLYGRLEDVFRFTFESVCDHNGEPGPTINYDCAV
ncbi:hypothetical protein HDU77_005478 [Chytriomyces hyalinus]|nr:hypothetical protein HDU77_005478 [Chytriomyces hyalinus]